MLGLTPTRSLADVLAAPGVDSASVQSGLLRHDSGVHVLPQPEHLDRLDGMTPQQIGAVLEILSSTFEITVVDTPHVLNDITLEVLDRSSSILLLSELSISSVRAARRSLEVFHKLNYTATPDRVRLVVNRHDSRSAITNDQVADTLQHPVFHHVANDYGAVSMAINVGKPLCGDHAESPAARDIVALAFKLVHADASDEAMTLVAPRRNGRLRLFRRG
jgi:pilus assembly protein CpaE